MAEQVTLFELDINVDAAIQGSADLQRKVDDLKKEIKELSKAEGDNAEAIAERNAQLKLAQQELRRQNKLILDTQRANNAATGSIEEMRAQLSVVSAQWAQLSEEERNNTEAGRALAQQKLELTEALRAEEAATGDNRRNVGNYTESIIAAFDATNGFGNALPDVIGGIQGMGGAFKALLANPVLLTLGAIVVSLKLLFDAFKKTQKGADALDKGSAALSATMEAISGILADLSLQLFEAFENPQQALKDFGNLIKDNIINRFEGMIELIPQLGKAIGLLFKGEFAEAGEVAFNAAAKATLGVENATEKILEFGEEVATITEKNIKLALELEAATKRFEEQNIRATTSLAKLNREAELQQQIADDSTQSFEDRAAAAEKARVASEEAAAIELSLAQEELRLIQVRNKQLKDNNQLLRENRQEQADLAAAVIEAEKQLTLVTQENAKVRDEINRDIFEKNLDYLLDNFDNIKGINERAAADDQKTFDARKAIIQATQELGNQAFAEQIKQLQTRTDAEIDANDLLAEADSKRLIEKVRLLKLDEIEETRLLEVIRDRRTAIEDLATAEVELEREKIEALRELRENDFNNRLEIERNNIFGQLDVERERLEEQRKLELEFAERVGADTTNIEAKYSAARTEINRAEQDAKLALAADFLGNIAQIAGEGTTIGKAAAAAQTAVSTIQAAQGAYAALAPIPIVGPALGIAAAAAAVKTGIDNVKKIYAVDSGLPGGSSIGGGSAPTPSAPTRTPVPRNAAAAGTVNQGIVSRGTQIDTDAISVQPTLVTDDVTVNQSREAANNQTATI